jgi:hypothetical protein
MDFVKAPNHNMVASSLLSPYAAIFKAFPATQYSSGLSPTAAEFVVPSAYAITTSDLSPHAVPFVNMSTILAGYDASPQATYFVPMSSYDMTSDYNMSLHATSFIPTSPFEATYDSGLSPHATTFVPTPAEQTTCYGNAAGVHSTLPVNYRPGTERIESVIASCGAVLISQYNDLKQHEAECARHYGAFLRWKYFERYDEPCQDEDIESVQSLADARDFRCTKCRDRGIELARQFEYTSDKYMRLVAMHGRASVNFAST